MARSIGCCSLCLVVLCWMGSLAVAAEPAAKMQSRPSRLESGPQRRQAGRKTDKAAAKREGRRQDRKTLGQVGRRVGRLDNLHGQETPLKSRSNWTAFSKPRRPGDHPQARGVDHADRRDGRAARRRSPQGRRAHYHGDEKLDHAIAELRNELNLSDVAIQQGQQQLRAMEKITPLDLESQQRTARMAHEDQKVFLDVERPFAVRRPSSCSR